MSFRDMSDEDVLAIATPMMDNLMQGSTEIDHEKHVRDFTPRLKAMVTRELLQEMCAEYQARIGYFTERELVAIFRRESSVAVVWRQYASQSDDEFVADIVIVHRDGEYLVDHALVF